MLAFVTEKTALGSQYPAVNFGAACGGQTAEMESAAPGLFSCPDLGADIGTCQGVYGKKVCLEFFEIVLAILPLYRDVGY